MKRRDGSALVIVIVLASFATACSFIFDMGRYDDGAGAGDPGPENAASSSGRNADGAIDAKASSGGSSGTDASSSSSSGDAAPPQCNQESEPNGTDGNATTLKLGENCGTVSSTEDVDIFLFTLNASTKISGAGIPGGVKAHVTDVPQSATNLTWQGGGGSTTLGPGNYRIEVEYNPGAGSRDYKITLGE